MRSKKGITVIEILVVIFLLTVLGAIVLPNLIGGPEKNHEASVRANMRIAQVAVEAYARDNNGAFPATVQDMKAYFPYGDNVKGGKDGVAPANPFSNKPEWPVVGGVKDIDCARVSRPDVIGDPGVIEYTYIHQGGRDSYAIRGADRNGKALAGVNQGSTLVMGPQ